MHDDRRVAAVVDVAPRIAIVAMKRRNDEERLHPMLLVEMK